MRCAVAREGRDGALVIEKVRSAPGTRKLAAELRPVLADLSRKFFDRAAPVFVTGDEAIVRTGLRVLREIPEANVREIEAASMDAFVASYGARHRSWSHTQRIQDEEAGGRRNLVLAHSSVAYPTVDVLEELFSSAGLELGGVVSQVLSLSALAVEGLRFLVHLGTATSHIVRFQDGRPAATTMIFAGAADLEADRERLFKALELELRSLLKVDDDGETEALEGPIGLTGPGLLHAELVDALAARLGVSCVAVDPAHVAGKAWPGGDEEPAAAFGPCLGAVAMLAGPQRDAVNVIATHVATAARQRAPETARRFDRTTLTAAAVTAALCVVGLGSYGAMLNAQIAALSRDIVIQRATLASPDEVRKVLQAHRTAQAHEMTTSTRARFLGALVEDRPDWRRVLDGLAAVVPAEGLALTRVRLARQWPGRSVQSARGATGQACTTSFELAGEAVELAAVTRFADALSRWASQSKLEESAPTAGAGGQERFAFRITGQVAR